MDQSLNVWNEIFADKGKVFDTVHADFGKFVTQLGTPQGKRILDLGCGSGRHVVALAKLGFDVWGLDAAPQGLALTKAALEEEGLQAHLLQQNMFDPFPYPDHFFDGVLSIQVIHHGLLAQVQAAADQVQRVLKPGGLLWVTVPRPRASAEKERGERRPSVEVEPNTYIPQDGFEKGLPHHIFSPEEFAGLFTQCRIVEQMEDGTHHQSLWAEKLEK